MWSNAQVKGGVRTFRIEIEPTHARFFVSGKTWRLNKVFAIHPCIQSFQYGTEQWFRKDLHGLWILWHFRALLFLHLPMNCLLTLRYFSIVSWNSGISGHWFLPWTPILDSAKDPPGNSGVKSNTCFQSTFCLVSSLSENPWKLF